MDRLEADIFTSALGVILNRVSNPTQMQKPAGDMLDAYLPRDYVSAGPDLIKFEGSQRSTFVGVIGLKGWPAVTTPMLFETLAAMDMEMIMCQIVRFLDPGESAATINPAIEYYHLTQYGLITHAIAKASGSEPEAKLGSPAIFLLDEDGNPSLINYQVKANLIVVERVAGKLLLKLGKTEVWVTKLGPVELKRRR